jgi:hypothetical protein
MNGSGWRKRCQPLESENQALRRDNAKLKEDNAALRAQNARLSEALVAATKNSGNSSKPPSSDIVKPPKNLKPRGKRRRRKIGGQKGHPKHERTPFTADQNNERIPYRFQRCPINPDHRIVPAEGRQRVLRQIELADQLVLPSRELCVLQD